MNYLYPIIATNRDGVSKLFYTFAEVQKFAFDKTNGGVGEYWEEYSTSAWYWNDKRYRPGSIFDRIRSRYVNQWILRDDRGRCVDPSFFQAKTPAWRDRRGNFEYRNGPVPGCTHRSGGHKMNHSAKKNSGARHRNCNRAKAIYEYHEYGVPNKVGNRVIPWEGY